MLSGSQDAVSEPSLLDTRGDFAVIKGGRHCYSTHEAIVQDKVEA
jgi:hypothetical protein